MGSKKIIKNEATRELLFRVADGNEAATKYLCILNRHPHCMRILRWLIASHLTGNNFVSWIQIQYDGSLELALRDAETSIKFL